MNQFSKIAAATVLAASIVGVAGQASAATKTQNALIGAVVGALGGALISHGDTTATVAGAGVGALIGAATDKPDRYRNDRYTTGYRSSYRTQQPYQNGYGYQRQYTGYSQPTYRTYDGGYYARPAGYDTYYGR